jgi:hypothetical protein
VPSSTANSSPNIIAIPVSGQWCLAGVPQSIATPANRRDVRSSIFTAVLSRSEVFSCALHLAYLTHANSVRAGKFRRITDTHFALAVIAKLSLSYVRMGPKAGHSSCHGFVGPSWPPSPQLGTGGGPAVNHRLGLSSLASTGGPGTNILHMFEGKSPAHEILFNWWAASTAISVALVFSFKLFSRCGVFSPGRDRPQRPPIRIRLSLDDALNKDYCDIVLQCAAEQPHPSDQFIDGFVHR